MIRANPPVHATPITVIDTLDGNRRKPLKFVNSYKYLGRHITQDGSLRLEIAARTQAANAVFWGLTQLWKAKTLKLKVRKDMYFSFVVSVLLNAAETWAPTQEELTLIERPYHRHLREMSGKKCHKTDTGAYITLHSALHVRRCCRVPALRDIIAQKQVTLAGSVYRRRDLPEELATWMFATREMGSANARGGQRQGWLKQAEGHMATMGLVWEDAYDIDRWMEKCAAKVPPALPQHEGHEEDPDLERDGRAIAEWHRDASHLTGFEDHESDDSDIE